MKIELGRTTAGKRAMLDLDRLITSRMLLQANSGGGKSWALRRLLEQSHGHVQQVVIDPEGEFYTLREKYDYVLAGKGGDCPAEPRSAEMLARRLLELGCSAVVDIYELNPRDRIRFVRLFVDALVNAPRKLWHPLMVVVDEAHTFAPEKGSAESFDAIAGLMSRGRKRGFCGVLATQRLAKLSKDVAAEANNVVVGRTRLDVDRKRAGEDLGFTSKADVLAMQNLQPGDFHAFGPAFDFADVAQIRVGAVDTPHPKAGATAAPIAAPRAKVKALLGELADLPAEAEEEARTVEALRAKVRELEREKQRLQRESGPSAEDLEHARQDGIAEGRAQFAPVIDGLELARKAQAEALQQMADGISHVVSELNQPLGIEVPQRVPTRPVHRPQATATRAATRHATAKVNGDGSTLPKGEAAILTACAQHADGCTRTQLTVLTGYKRSTRDAYIQRLRERGFVEVGGDGRVRALDDGFAALGPFDPLPTGDALRDYWLEPGRLPEGERLVLAEASNHWPSGASREAISEATGYKRSTRDAYIQRLNARELVEIDRGEVRAAATLFEL